MKDQNQNNPGPGDKNSSWKMCNAAFPPECEYNRFLKNQICILWKVADILSVL